ncbi:MAG: hypothetical protein QOE79_2891 [Sphingomonadales bacterium]|nr:hypothetical protein [Sphingomonadales bacterium]
MPQPVANKDLVLSEATFASILAGFAVDRRSLGDGAVTESSLTR